MDFAKPDIEGWSAGLAGSQAVINCVGALQDGPAEDTQAAHATGAAALFAASEAAGVARLIHFSAIGVDRHQASAFSASKLAGEQALRESHLDWIVLRPSVVLGRAVFGASALFRGLSALPITPVMEGTGDLQVVMLDDVVETVVRLVDPAAPAQIALDLAGPEPLSMAQIVARFRCWQGWKPARAVPLSGWAGALVYKAGDMAGALGWRPPARSTARREIVHGATGDPATWKAILGRAPIALDAWLDNTPATVQDRWFAKLYLLKPALFVVLAGFWIATGVISLTTGFDIGVGIMLEAGTGPLAAPGVIAGALADIAIGLAIAWRRTSWYGLWGAIGLSCFYILAGSVLLPELWNEPLGPLLKIWPILVAHFVALALLDER